MDYNGTGMSVMEMSHRSQAFQEIIDTAEADLRELMNIPDNYKVLFLQGGASQQFAMIPMNLMKHGEADYIVIRTVGEKRHGRKLRSMVRRIRLRLPRIRHFPIFRIALLCQSQRMQTMCISAKITQYTERNTKSFQTPR